MKAARNWALRLALSLALGIAVCLAASPLMAADGAALYKARCAGCHGPDGTGSAIGKRLGVHDFHSAEVKKMSDAEMEKVIENGKGKMPPYKSLSPEEVKALVAHIRELGK
jgi:cytochrome c6